MNKILSLIVVLLLSASSYAQCPKCGQFHHPYNQPTQQYGNGANEALAEVNATRARRGLRPFIFDAGLTQAAQRCAQVRAARRIQGHTSNDFSYVPAGTSARSAGCAAWEPSMGWGSCCTYDNYTYAGAAWAMGSDGRRYMHLFVR